MLSDQFWGAGHGNRRGSLTLVPVPGQQRK